MNQHIVDLRNQEKNNNGSHDAASPEAKEVPVHLRTGKKLLEWQTLEFIERPKNEGTWIRWIGTLAFLLSLTFFLLKNFLGIVVVIVGAFAFLLQAFRKPRTVRLAVTDKGFEVNEKLYSFTDISSFWIFNDSAETKEISFKSKKLLATHLRFPLGTTDPIKLRDILLKFIPEEEQHLSLIEAWMRRIGF